ncbi:MAG: hypothetical protein IKS20_04300, partial [Victivallales bacterium]|nr:hypothetical protein [Victivallales bacterium]
VKNSIPAIVDAARRAKEALQDTAAGFASGKNLTGVSRRGMNEEGVVTGFIADPYMPYDDNMTVVHFVSRTEHQTLGIVVHCGAHNTCMGADRNISSDWCGVMKRRVFQRYGVPVLFINGALGDVGPRCNRWMEKFNGFSAGGGDGVASAEEVGYRAASDALHILEGIRDFRSDLPLRANTSTISLPQSIPISEERAKEIIRKYGESECRNDIEPPLDYQLAKIAVETWKQAPQPNFEFEQTVLAFGPLALAPFPFEMFSIFSLRLRKFGPYQYTLICSNTNGRNAYMPDRGAIACGGYEPECRKTIRPYVLEPQAGDLAVVQTLESLRRLQAGA